MAKNDKGISDKTSKDEKKKKQLNLWSYYLAWGAFVAAVLSAFVKLVEKWEIPKKDEHYQ